MGQIDVRLVGFDFSPRQDLLTEFSVNIVDMFMPSPKCWIPSCNSDENHGIHGVYRVFNYLLFTGCIVYTGGDKR